MRSYRNSNSRNVNLVIDLLGVLLALVIGIGGLIVVADPIKTLFPKHPMISSQDWPGSRSTQGLEILNNTQQWDEERGLFIRLKSEEDANGDDAEITQKARWHADMTEGDAMWRRLDNDWNLISENFISRDRPASRLYCREDLYPPIRNSCYFFAYRGHWYTEIHFTSDSDEYLSLSEVQQIISRAEQLLMSTSDEHVTAMMPLQAEQTSAPYVIAITPTLSNADISNLTSIASEMTSVAIDPNFPISTPMMFNMPTVVNLQSCALFQRGETRIVAAGTFILGDVVVDGVEQYDANTPDEGTVIYFEKESTVTAPGGADCYTGSNELIYHVIQNELNQGCDSKCTSIRFVLVQRDGQHVEIYK